MSTALAVEPETTTLTVAAAVPSILVIGKKNCGKCESMKQKLTDHLKLEFEFFDWAEMDLEQFDWRNSDIVDIVADANARDIDITHFPTVGINGIAYDYAGAIKELKRLKG